jgi:hypothetical protein
MGNQKELRLTPFNTRSCISDIVDTLGVDPRLKLFKIISTPEINKDNLVFTNNSWSSLIKRGYLMLINGSNEAKINWSEQYSVKIKSFMTFYRGRNLYEINDNSHIFTNLANKLGVDYKENLDKNELNKYEKHLTILSNSSFLCNDLNKTINKAEDMLNYNAFLHQYEKYGMTKNDFIDALAFCEQINYDYNN